MSIIGSVIHAARVVKESKEPYYDRISSSTGSQKQSILFNSTPMTWAMN